jgi:hypothetical protein
MKILSYPRSGSNFLYYSLSVIGIYLGKTHGQNKEFWLDTESDKKLVFMIRNYKESIPRQIDGYKFDDRFKSQISNYRTDNDDHHFDYISILDYYDKYTGPKIIIYYEDFINDTKNELIKVVDFISDGIDNTILVEEFIKNIEFHKKSSSDRYNSMMIIGCKSINDNKVDLLFHSNKITKVVKNKIDRYLYKNYKELFSKYLTRYLEKI